MKLVTFFVLWIAIYAAICIGGSKTKPPPESHRTCDACVEKNYRWCRSDRSTGGKCISQKLVKNSSGCAEEDVPTDKNSTWNCMADCDTCTKAGHRWCEDHIVGACVTAKGDEWKFPCYQVKGKWATTPSECPAPGPAPTETAVDIASSYLACDGCVKNNHQWCRKLASTEGSCVTFFEDDCADGTLQIDHSQPLNCIADCRECIQAGHGWCTAKSGFCAVGARLVYKGKSIQWRVHCKNNLEGKFVTNKDKC